MYICQYKKAYMTYNYSSNSQLLKVYLRAALTLLAAIDAYKITPAIACCWQRDMAWQGCLFSEHVKEASDTLCIHVNRATQMNQQHNILRQLLACSAQAANSHLLPLLPLQLFNLILMPHMTTVVDSQSHVKISA